MITTAKRVIFGLCLISAMLTLAYFISSSIVPVRCRSVLSRSNVQVGDRIRYSVNVVALRGLTISIPDMEKDFSEFSIIDKGMHVSRFMGKTRTAKWYQLIQYKPGVYSIQPVVISFTNDDGSPSRIETEPLRLEVKSVLTGEEKTASGITISGDLAGRSGAGSVSSPAKEMDDAPVRLSIADVNSPLDLLTLTDIGIIGAGGIIFIAAFLFIAAMIRKARTKMAHVSPYESASAQLKKIRADDALIEDGLKEFYSKLSRILGGYIGTVLGTGPKVLTTGDLLSGIGSCEKFDELSKNEARELFLLCDLVKFSGFKPDRQAIEASLNNAKRITEAIHKNEEAKEIKK